MNAFAPPHTLASCLDVLRRRLAVWLTPAILVAALVGGYAWLRPATWEVSQALIVRHETAGQESPSSFLPPEQMKTLQETVLELARSRSVLADALVRVGPPSGSSPAASWPDEEDIVALRDAIKLAAPKGAEFGKTEVFYLKVRDSDRARAADLVAALCGRLEAGLEDLRDAHARKTVAELEKSVTLAEGDLSAATARLGAIETSVGSNLSELRLLQDANSGESPLRRSVSEIRAELRQARAAEKSSREHLALLSEAKADPGRLLAAPAGVFESQPGLRRLKDGLVDAQITAAQLKGRMSDAHPLVRAAVEAQQQIARRLRDELAAAADGIANEIRVSEQRIALAEQQLAAATANLEQIAALRAPYANQVAATRKRSELLERAQQRLADARASLASAKAGGVLAHIDDPDAGAKPLGPSRAVWLVLAVVGGLLTGLGVLLLVPAGEVVSAGGAATPQIGRRRDDARPAPRRRRHNDLSVSAALAQLGPEQALWSDDRHAVSGLCR